MIRFVTLGAVRLLDSTGSDVDLAGRQPKRLALLAYLALARPRGPQRRDRIVAMLWPELDQDRARSALRQALHSLRRALGDDLLLTSGMNEVTLNPAAIQCDAWELETAAARGGAAEAAGLLHGDLLSGLFVSDAAEFEQWLDDERARVRATASKLFLDAARATSDAHECAEWIAHALRVAPLDEAAVRLGMELLAEHRDRSGALALFDETVRRLQTVLEDEPAPETAALAAAIRAMPVADAPPPRVRERAVATPRRARRTAGLSLAATVAVMLLAANTYVGGTPADRDARVVAVVGEGGAAVRAALTSSRLVTVLDAGAGLARASTVVRISTTTDADSARLHAEVVDATRGTILRAVDGPWTRGDVSIGAAAFAEHVATAVATALYPGWGNGLSEPPSLAAYRAFVEGMAEIKRERHESAATLFSTALREDSGFTAAALLAAAELYQLGRHAAADTIVRSIARRRAQLPPVDMALLDWMDARLRGDRLASFVAISRVASLAPGAELAQIEVAIEANETARPAIALAMLDRLAASSDFGEAWPGYWANRAETLHMMGDHEHELADIRRALAAHPEMRLLEVYELRALAALGRIAEVRTRIAMLTAGEHTPAVMSMIRQSALELRAHGHPEPAAQILADMRRSFDNGQVSLADTLARTLGLARTAYLQDDRSTARRIYAQIAHAAPSCIDCIGLLGVLAARDGDTVATVRADRQLLSASAGFVFGRNTLWRARIAATLGDAGRAATTLRAAFTQGLELDIDHHTDPALAGVDAAAVYRSLLACDARCSMRVVEGNE
jgi:serine/threonine-protein kinase